MDRAIGFRHIGAKYLLSPDILRFLPKTGRKFVDVFAGRGNVTFAAIHRGFEYDEWILNDIRQFRFFEALREYGDKIVVRPKAAYDLHDLRTRAIQHDPEALILEPFMTWNGCGYEAGGSSLNKCGGSQSPENFQERVRHAHKLLNSGNIRISNLDWMECLKREGVGNGDAVFFDPPYIGANLQTGYTPEDICPNELIAELRCAEYRWALTEYEQPIYVQALGEPVFRKNVQQRADNIAVTGGQDRRIECIWASDKLKQGVTVTVEPVPEDRTDVYYRKLPLESLLAEIKKGVELVSFHRVQMQREMRVRLLPALIELKKRTLRKKPGYYETLKKMGFNADTVRQWFYRSNTAEEIIDLVEEKAPEQKPKEYERDGALDAEALLLQHADNMAQAVLDGKITYAKRLATEYVKVRNEDRVL
jgi:16S rRNA G966 N2-methylase RsmD